MIQWEQEKYEFPEGLKSSNSGGSGVSIEDLNLVYGNGRFVLTASARYGWSGRLLAYSSNGRQWTNLISKESVSSTSHCCGKSISPFNFNLGNISGLAFGVPRTDYEKTPLTLTGISITTIEIQMGTE